MWGLDISLEKLNLEYNDLLTYDDIVKLRTMASKNFVLHLLKKFVFQNSINDSGAIVSSKATQHEC